LIRRRIKKDCGSFICIQDWIWLGKFSWGRNVYVTLERKEENMEVESILIIVVENG
jgi:hypothetical protein